MYRELANLQNGYPETTDHWIWIVVMAGLAGCFVAFGIGANDVANAFATSVGAKTLTLTQAVCVAAIFELTGSILLGSHVSKTIRGGIADLNCFKPAPGILMYGMMTSLWSTGIWLILATTFGLPVSTTHSIIGAIIGMAMSYKGSSCVIWINEVETFPYFGGVAAIVLSWIFSPVMAGGFSMILFFLVRFFVLRARDSYRMSFIFYPFLVLMTIVINVFFVLYKGAASLPGMADYPLSTVFAISFGCGGGVALVIILLTSRIRAYVDSRYDLGPDGVPTLKAAFLIDPVKDAETGAVGSDGKLLVKVSPSTSVWGKMGAMLTAHLTKIDVHKATEDNELVKKLHGNAEKFDPRCEEVFSYIQVFTACCMSFAHGANDVANGVGPFMAVFSTYKQGKVVKSDDLAEESYWILAMGGGCIVLGLFLYGYQVIESMGVKMAKISPSRGFAVELCAALVILVGSKLGLPLSSTHCTVGAIIGVGLCESKGGFCSGVNWVQLGITFTAWAATLVVCGLTSALFFAQGAYAPSVFCN